MTTTTTITTTPQSTIVFIVGNCAEYEEGRAATGDEQLFDCFQSSSLYGARTVVFVKDDDCTKANCQEQFKEFLQTSSKPGDTLVFFYGGHGTKKGFRTQNRETWQYKDAIHMMETLFQGNQIWCLIDCCYAGCFANHINTRDDKSDDKSWLCLMSTEGTVEAGDEWCMTNTWCNAMKGQYEGNGNDGNGNDISTQDVVELMEDHHAILKNDWMQATLIIGSSHIDPMAPFPFKIPKQNLPSVPTTTTTAGMFGLATLFVSSLFIGIPSSVKTRSTNNQQQQQAATVATTVVDPIKWKRLVGLQKGDKVFCKWHGGSPPKYGAPYLFPLYYPATILSDTTTTTTTTNNSSSAEDDRMIEVQFHHLDWRWKATVSFYHHILPASYLWMVFDDYFRAHTILTKHGRYLDATVLPGTKVWTLFEDDDVVYTGTVLDLAHIDWHKVDITDYYLSYSGPFLWIEWDGEDEWTIVPRSHCVVIVDSAARKKPTLIELQHRQQPTRSFLTTQQAILQHLESMGKHLILQGQMVVSCLWGDGKWHEAVTCNTMPSPKVLREHLQFENCQGNYYCVRWKEDNTYSLIPEKLVKLSA